jgi:hypothetical protein
MTPRRIAIHIGRIDLASRVPGGERRLREAIGRELASFAASDGDERVPLGERSDALAVARQVRARVMREAGR